MSRSNRPRCSALLLLLLIAAFSSLAGQSTANQFSRSHTQEVPTATEIRLTDPGWWPTKGSAKRDDYVGYAACAGCHADIFDKQKNTPMAHALTVAGPAAFEELARGPLQFHLGSYTYELSKTATGATYSVNDGDRSISVAIGWIVGNSQLGRTYIYQQSGNFFESRMSYYRSLAGLDFTTGNPRSVPGRLEAALGRHVARDEIPFCFGCHSTASRTSNVFDPSRLMAGVTCEACHGPGAEHVGIMNLGQGDQSPAYIMNPTQLDPVASVDYCGACHRTSVDVSLMGVKGILTIRFPAYRLQHSRCWNKPDSRLTCVACHAPHQPLIHNAASYDKNCLACHSGSSHNRTTADARNSRTARGEVGELTCPVGRTACVSCHMPQYQIPEMHATFTDHKIAVHRQGAPFVE